MSSNQTEKKVKQETDIIINLDDSSNTRAFAESQQVHAIQFEKVTRWIDDAICGASANNLQERLQDTISILGSRGSGKTSFLLSLIDKYKKEKDVVVIDIIDPTLIEQKGHIFLTVISQIKDLVDDKLKGYCNLDCSSYGKRQIWEKKLEKLAHGLPSVDGVGQPNEGSWQDPEYIMHKGLRAVQSAKDLEMNFHEFVKESLDILEKKIFLLMLDDIDVDFSKGWPVLETLRKYLTTPKIVTLLSGDIDLFAKSVRKQQWKNFGKPLLVNEGELLYKIGEYNDLVTEMESQYLQKVLKPQRRIRLNTIGEKLEKGVDNIKVVEKKDGGEGVEIKAYYRNILQQFGVFNDSQAEPYLMHLLNLPLRTQIQFLSYFVDASKQTEITDSFLSDLNEKLVDVDLAISMPKMLDITIFRLLLQENALYESYQLQPNTSDKGLNSSLMALGFLFSQSVASNPNLIFDFFIRVGYVRSLYGLMRYEEENDKRSNFSIPSLEGLRVHSELFMDKDLHDISGNITAYMRGFLNYKNSRSRESLKPFAGSMVLKGLNENARGKEPHGRIDYVFGKELNLDNVVAYIPLSISAYTHKNTSLTTYSIFNLLATISDIIRAKGHVEKMLQRAHQFWEYKIPEFGKDIAIFGEGNTSPTNEYFVAKEGPEISLLTHMLEEWIERYPSKKIIPHLLGKLLSRFYHALENIERENKFDSLGEAMHIRIVALLNAILIEDVRENIKETVSLNLNNVLSDDDLFLQNISAVLSINDKAKDDKLSFSSWLLSCPLLLLYLNEEKMNNLKKYVIKAFRKADIQIDEILSLSVYEKLKEVDLRGEPDRKRYISISSKGRINETQRGSVLISEKPKFGKKYFDVVLPVLQKRIGYELFMNGDLEAICTLCKFYFDGQIRSNSVLKIRERINEEQIKW